MFLDPAAPAGRPLRTAAAVPSHATKQPVPTVPTSLDPPLPGFRSLPELALDCAFGPDVFADAALALAREPPLPPDADAPPLDLDSVCDEGRAGQPLPDVGARVPGFAAVRTLVRRLVPRAPARCPPVSETWRVLRAEDGTKQGGARQQPGRVQTLLLVTTHGEGARRPTCSLAVVHDCGPRSPGTGADGARDDSSDSDGATLVDDGLPLRCRLMVQIRLSPDQVAGTAVPVPDRLLHAAEQLLLALRAHGERLAEGAGPPAAVPRRTRATYAALKQRHLHRLCDAWDGPGDPTRQVLADLAIAAWLLEAWRTLYALPARARWLQATTAGPCAEDAHDAADDARCGGGRKRPPFPGFVDLACGTGFLTDVLLREGYDGWGLDGRRRATWAHLAPGSRTRLRELLVVPRPLLDLAGGGDDAADAATPTRTTAAAAAGSDVAAVAAATAQRLGRTLASLARPSSRSRSPSPTTTPPRPTPKLHEGVFPRGTFLVASHADALTAWVPLLAALSGSAFAVVPCCAHNLAGARFRAPSLANSLTADAAAPAFFAPCKRGPPGTPAARSVPIAAGTAAEHGDLRALGPAARAAGPSAYSGLCAWVAHLAREAGFAVERTQMQYSLSGRNIGLVGWQRAGEEAAAANAAGAEWQARRRVAALVRREGADAETWARTCLEGLAKDAVEAGH